MTNRTWYAQQHWHLGAETVDCPACKLTPTEKCPTCQNRRVVEADRVCLTCGQFKAYCLCEGHRNTIRTRRPRKGKRG